jgi:hypothetical protein
MGQGRARRRLLYRVGDATGPSMDSRCSFKGRCTALEGRWKWFCNSLLRPKAARVLI